MRDKHRSKTARRPVVSPRYERHEPPQARLIGGDRLRGSTSLGPGHAGRVALGRGVGIGALIVLLTVLMVLGINSILDIQQAEATARMETEAELGVRRAGGRFPLDNPDGSIYLSQLLGVTREDVVAELEAHENDSYYIGTPYLGLGDTGDLPRPNGDHGSYAPGMQCNGFVCYVLNKVGGTPYQTFVNRDGQRGGWASLVNWYAAARDNDVISYRFDTKEELLSSGLAHKGDIICATARVSGSVDQYGNPTDDHVGFFWGSTSDDDRYWHSSHVINGITDLVDGNQISPLEPKCFPSSWVLFPMGPTTGGIELNKTSTNTAITTDNGCYSLAGATYGVYSDEACTRLVASLTTDENGHASATDISAGSYWVKETGSPASYAVDVEKHAVTVISGQTASVDVSDAPLSASIDALVEKLDANGAEVSGSRAQAAQGNASLAGAQFTVSYYANTDGETDGNAVRTWVFQTDDSGVVSLSNKDSLVSGDGLYQDKDGNIVMPLGTYAIRESAAPRGYVLSDTTTHVLVTSAGDDRSVTVRATEGWNQKNALAGVSGRAVADRIIRGGVRFHKVDAETGASTPQGGASLAGATIAIRNMSAGAVCVNGTWYDPGEDCLTLTTDASGCCSTASDALPMGTYEARETKASEGYKLNDSWHTTFSITKDGEVVDLAGDALKQQVVRGDLSGVKADAKTQERMAGVAFLLTNDASGEGHVIVCDENGGFDTSSTERAHSEMTNANDAAYDADANALDETKLDASAGVWFGKTGDTTSVPNDELGALPYGHYTLRELAGKANANHALVTIPIVVSRDGTTVELGTIDDQEREQPAIATTLASASGEKVVPQAATVTLVDTVSYEGLARDKDYTLKGELHVVNADGSGGGVVATSESTFRPTTSFGTTDTSFTLDTSAIGGRTLVAFESLYEGDTLVARHADLTDRGQTVSIPGIQTTLAGDADHEANASASIKLTDTVRYEGLEVGRGYTLSGTLHLVRDDGADAGEVMDANGNPVTAQTSFVPDKPAGTAEVTFEFTAPALAGKTVVAFEDLTSRDITYATHADIADKGQSVGFPSVHTTATSSATGDHDMPDEGIQTVRDEVSLENLTTGKDYIVSGELHVIDADGTDLGVANNSKGEPATAKASFTADAPTKSVELSFEVDASELAGAKTVVFESLSTDGIEVAAHADASDENQTVRCGDIRTTLVDAESGTHERQVPTGQDGVVSLVDHVSYTNLLVGKEYTLTGTLHLVGEQDEDAGELKGSDGKAVSAQATFKPEEPDGVVDVTFEFDASELSGRTVVAYETLERNGITLATHADITDKEQSLHFVQIKTTAIDQTDGNQQLAPQAGVTIKDHVEYENLTPGETYELTGTLHLVGEQGEDAGELRGSDGKVVTAHASFTPSDPAGSQDLLFTVDASDLGGRSLVVFETLTHGELTVATHADITDKGQTVQIATLPSTEASVERGQGGTPFTGDAGVSLALVGIGIASVTIAMAARLRRGGMRHLRR